MGDKKTNWIKVYIIDVLPCITVLLYILAIFYNQALFSVFNINILKYASMKDLFFSILDALVFISFLSISTLWCIFYFDITNKVYKKGFHSKNSKIEETDRNADAGIYLFNLCLLFAISCGIVFILYFLNWLKIDMTGAAFALFLPVMLVMGTYCYLWNYNIDYPKFNFIRDFSTKESIVTIALYLIYAYFIFSYSGWKTGEYIMEHESVPFEIKVSDGTIYTNEDYKIISIFNDRVFLYEKETERTIILNRGSMAYLKCDDRNEIINTGSFCPFSYGQ